MRWRLGEFLKEVRKGLPDTLRIPNSNSRHSQSNHRKTHRHPVIVIGLDLGAMQRARSQTQRIPFLDDHGPALLKFRVKRLHALAFLDAKPPEVHKSFGPI